MLAAGIQRWPTWQEAWVATVCCVIAYLVLRRARPSRFTEIALPTVHELAVLTGLYGLWRTAKHLPLTQADGAMERARSIVEFQERIGLPAEVGMQQWVIDHDPLGWLSAVYYLAMHVPGLIAFLAWLFFRHRNAYPRWRNVLALTTAGCLFIRFVHVAPPRFLTDLGYQDLSEVYGWSVYGPVGTGVSGQFVAMPSIHVAWAGVVGFGVVAASPSRWKWIAAAHFPITMWVVMVTGHHWWLDGLVAIGLIIASLAVDEAVRRMWRAVVDPGPTNSELRDDRVEQVVVGGEGSKLGELGDHVVG